MDGSLRAAYREQYDMYPSLTQEEVEALYAREGIIDKPISEIIKELEDEISSIEQNTYTRLREIHEAAKSAHEKLYYEASSPISELEEKKAELERIQSELEGTGIDSSNGILSTIEVIDKELEKLVNKYLELEDEWKRLLKKKDTVLFEEGKKVLALEEKISKLKLDYATVFKDLYSSSRGIIRRKRKFPSQELRNEIVLGHLGLARFFASKYYKMCDKQIEFDDLHQTAYEALMSAAHYYIPSKRAKFKTYATKCIENKLRRAIGEVKKKKKKRTTKPLEFIDEELRRIDYVVMLINSCRNVTGKDGNKYFTNHFDLKPIGIQYTFKKSIRSYNKELRQLGLTKEQLPFFKVKKSESGFQEILGIALSYMKESKIRVLIGSDEMEVASLVVSYENRKQDVREVYELLYIIESYQKRLKDVRLLLEAEIDLANNSDGIVPSMDELLEEVNRRIAVENKGIYKAKNSSTRVFFRGLENYRAVYDDLWGIDILAPEEYHRKKRTKYVCEDWKEDYIPKGRALEKQDIEEEFEYKKSERLLYYRSLLDDIECSSDDEEHLYKHFEEDDDGRETPFEFWDDDSFDALEKRVFSKEQAIGFVKNLMQELENLTKEEYVDGILKWRRQITLDSLNETNANIIEGNKAIEDTVRQQRATGYVRYWTMENVQNATDWMNALYESGLSIRNFNPDRNVRQSQSVEDEAIENLFLADYNKALDELPTLAREVLSLYYDENGMHSTSAREIAGKLGITEKAVYREKAKALKMLQKNDTLRGYLDS